MHQWSSDEWGNCTGPCVLACKVRARNYSVWTCGLSGFRRLRLSRIHYPLRIVIRAIGARLVGFGLRSEYDGCETYRGVLEYGRTFCEVCLFIQGSSVRAEGRREGMLEGRCGMLTSSSRLECL